MMHEVSTEALAGPSEAGLNSLVCVVCPQLSVLDLRPSYNDQTALAPARARRPYLYRHVRSFFHRPRLEHSCAFFKSLSTQNAQMLLFGALS